MNSIFVLHKGIPGLIGYSLVAGSVCNGCAYDSIASLGLLFMVGPRDSILLYSLNHAICAIHCNGQLRSYVGYLHISAGARELFHAGGRQAELTNGPYS